MEQKIRTRCGSASTFERRFQPIIQNEEDGSVIVEPWDVPPDADYRYWWTVVDGGDKLYVGPGFHFVNRIGYIQCEKPWSDDDLKQPDYVY